MIKILSGAIVCSIATLGLAVMPASAGKFIHNNSNMGGVGHSNFPGFNKPIIVLPRAFFGPIKPGFGGGRPVAIIKKVPVFRGFRGGSGMW